MRAWADDGRASLVEILTPNGSRSGGVALLRPSRSALRRSKLDHGHGQVIGARMHGSAPWKTEETIVGMPRLLVLSAFSRSDSPDSVAHLSVCGLGGCHLSVVGFSRFGGCHLSVVVTFLWSCHLSVVRGPRWA